MIIKNTSTPFGYLKRTGIRYQCKIKLPQYCQTWLFDHIPAGIETIHVTFVDVAGIFSAAVIHLDVPNIRTQFFSASVPFSLYFLYLFLISSSNFAFFTPVMEQQQKMQGI